MSEERENVIEFTDEDGNSVELNVLCQTEINGDTFFLVTEDVDFSFDEEDDQDNEDDLRFVYKDGEVAPVNNKKDELDCYILKVTEEGDEELTLEMLDDEEEIEAILNVFGEIMNG